MRKYALVFSATFVVFTALAQTVTRGPYLQSLTPTGIKVKWRTDAATDSRVSYGINPGNLSLTNDVAASVTEHTVELTGLQPYTTYYYSIGTTSQVLSGPDSLHYFKTAPVSGTVQPYRFWAIGDFGKANQGQVDVMNSCATYTGSNHIDMWLWLGDCAYDHGTDAEYQTKVFDVYKGIMKYMPFYSAPGNHDYENVCAIPCFKDPATHTGPYLDIIDVPENGEAGGVASGYELYYSFDYGNVHFISLNSELGSLTGAFDWNGVFGSGNFTGSPVRQWLIDDLAANALPWVVVYFHQPPYTKGSHDSDNPIEIYMKAMRDNYGPIFEQHGVDIVLCGHSHVYERSYLMKGFYGSQYPTSSSFDTSIHVIQNKSGKYSLGEAYVKYTTGSDINVGTVYVVNGNSGSREQGASLNHPAMYYGDDGYGSFMLEVNGMRLDGKYLSSTGVVLDEFTILKTPHNAVLNGVNVSICNGDSVYAGGAYQTATGTYYDTISSGSGPDTIQATYLVVISPVVPTISQQSHQLSVPDNYAGYQWYQDGLELPGSNLPALTATADGEYYVKVTDANGCTANSNTVNVVMSGINDPEKHGIRIFPNPLSNEFAIILPGAMSGDLNIDIYNSLGKKVIASQLRSFNGNQVKIHAADLIPGVYTVKVTNNSVEFAGRVMKR